ncbi:MAG: RdgB/HAM1 family non-canonical purine NTP pyrophosphatase [Treponema sp.]|jgi:XTP/dITP diphosphohydrolase|nr:RdgB/HAM1 family non-canonical purine NTP pyrophosphatase [Treponema sp.]
MTLWFATGNAHKKAELEAVLRPILCGHRIKIPADSGFVFDPEETGATFCENALIKARALHALVKKQGFSEPVIADDSGLCVDALGGRPGIYSARYAGRSEPRGSSKKLEAPERNVLLLEELGDNPLRSARFVCAMVLMFNEDRFYIVQETLEGEIVKNLDEAKGAGGFGYDPILWLPEKKCTVAELSEEEKNLISHRGKAAMRIGQLLTCR